MTYPINKHVVFPKTVEELLNASDRKVSDPDAPDVVPTNSAMADLCRRLIALEDNA